jgi:1-deoxy-D-xylulose-5-phosphate synthase
MPAAGEVLEIGKGRVLREGTAVALLSYGTRLADCLAAADELLGFGLSTTVADARFCKPLDHDLVRRLGREHAALITVEEGAIGGFSTHVMNDLAHAGVLEAGCKFRPMFFQDLFVDQDSQANQNKVMTVDTASIVKTALTALGHAAAERQLRA